MKCKRCGGDYKIVETAQDDNYTYRKRECKECGDWIFTTEEESDFNKTYTRMRILRTPVRKPKEMK